MRSKCEAKQLSKKPLNVAFFMVPLEARCRDSTLYKIHKKQNERAFAKKYNNVVMISFGKVLPNNDYLYGFFPYAFTNKRFLNRDSKDKQFVDYYNRALSSSTEKERLQWAHKLAKTSRRLLYSNASCFGEALSLP